MQATRRLALASYVTIPNSMFSTFIPSPPHLLDPAVVPVEAARQQHAHSPPWFYKSYLGRMSRDGRYLNGPPSIPGRCLDGKSNLVCSEAGLRARAFPVSGFAREDVEPHHRHKGLGLDLHLQWSWTRYASIFSLSCNESVLWFPQKYEEGKPRSCRRYTFQLPELLYIVHLQIFLLVVYAFIYWQPLNGHPLYLAFRNDKESENFNRNQAQVSAL